MKPSRSFVDEPIIFDRAARSFRPGFDAVRDHHVTAQLAKGPRAREQRPGDEFSMHGVDDDRLDAVVLDALFERLL